MSVSVTPAPTDAGARTSGGDARPVERGDVARVNDAVQALFEFDGNANAFVWSDRAAVSRLVGRDFAAPQTPLADFDALMVGQPPAARVAALKGEAQSYSCEYQLRDADDAAVWFEERGGWIDVSGEKRLIGVLRSIDAEKRASADLSWRADYDELTGVRNRAQLRRGLDNALCAPRARRGAYLVAGIDDVGAINADFGFDAADNVIKEIAGRLSACLGDGDAIGRVAGTKIGIVVADASDDALRALCIRLLNAVREDVIETDRGAVAASICIGAIDLDDDLDANNAMARAEAALDQAKRMGRSSWSAFSEKTDVVSQRRRNTHMSDVILTALNERRVRLAFQPIVADLDEPASKFECLIRMLGEDGREVPAPEFIPVAERLGLVHLLDRRVLELAINTLVQAPNVSLAVNISMETVKDPVWAEGYLSLMRANASLARRITVELTETRVIDAVDASIEFVSEIKKLGATFAIDDFGAGYTSFRNLKALDIDILKIDGSFVTGVASSRDNQLFVRTLLDLARNFGMKTVAEWVDDEGDAMLLKGLGVDYLQGFMIGRPETNPVWLPDGAPNGPPATRI
ncbi:MAG: EAL domain-containing protein [Parvularculaceae bacterium]